MPVWSDVSYGLALAGAGTLWAGVLLRILGKISERTYLKLSITGDAAFVASGVVELPSSFAVIFTGIWTAVLIWDVRRYRNSDDDDDKPKRRRRRLRAALKRLRPRMPAVRIPRLHPVPT